LLAAVRERLAAGEQSLIFIQPPRLCAGADVPRLRLDFRLPPGCSAQLVLHLSERRLPLPPLRARCTDACRLPRLRQSRPAPVGQGTQRVERH